MAGCMCLVALNTSLFYLFFPGSCPVHYLVTPQFYLATPCQGPDPQRGNHWVIHHVEREFPYKKKSFGGFPFDLSNSGCGGFITLIKTHVTWIFKTPLTAVCERPEPIIIFSLFAINLFQKLENAVLGCCFFPTFAIDVMEIHNLWKKQQGQNHHDPDWKTPENQ